MAEHQRRQMSGMRPADQSKHVAPPTAFTHDVPVPSCPMWFASEINGKDHLEWIHSFTEGRGYSFYDCLRQFGLEWFGRRSFFGQRDTAGQALWMDLALTRHSGQELHNDYVLTTSPAFGHLRKFFRAAVREIVLAYNDYPGSRVAPVAHHSICDQMRRDIDDSPQGSSHTSPVDSVVDIPVVESLSPLILSSTPPPPVIDTPVRSMAPNNRSLSFLQTGPVEHPQVHFPQSRGGAVSSVSIASTDLLYYVEPLPLDQFIYHDVQAVRAWPDTAREELLAVARRDIAVARRNLTDLTRYLDMHDAHLAACSGRLNDNLPLMSVETFPRATGGIQSALDEADRMM